MNAPVLERRPLVTVAGPPRLSRETLAHLLIVAIATATWFIALPDIDLSATSGWGLLSALPGLWWVALVLAVVPQAVAALRARIHPIVFWGYQAVLAAILYATTSATYELPRYPWTYKHVGVVEYLLAGGAIDRSLDIYNNWPGAFVFAAAVSRVTGVEPLALAQWTQPVLALLTAFAVAFAVGGLARDRRVIWSSVLLYSVTNWVGQNYFAPQAAATLLALLFTGVVLRALPVRGAGGRPEVRRWLERPVRRLRAGVPALPVSARWQRPEALVAATLLWAALVTTHQLTPVAVALQLVGLALVVRVRVPWLVMLWLAIEAWWVALAMPFIGVRWNLLQFDALGSLAPEAGTPVLPGAATVTSAAAVLVMTMAVLALAVAVVRLRRGRIELVAAVLVAAPAVMVLTQSYGGEGLFRVYLYTLPWLAFLVASAAVRLTEERPRRMRFVLPGAIAVLMMLSAGASFGQELLHRVTPGDLAASTWFETGTAAGSYVEPLVGKDMSLKVTAAYALHDPSRSAGLHELAADMQAGHIGVAAFLDLAGEHFAENGPNGYLAITEYQYTYGRYYGEIDETRLDAVADALERRLDYRVEYHQGEIVLARYVGSGEG